MRNMLALVGAIVVTVGGFGWYLDWFKVRNNPAPPGYRSVNIDINTVKISEDLHRGSVKVQEVLEKNKEAAEAKSMSSSDIKAAIGKTSPVQAIQSEIKKKFTEEGEEAEDSPFDFRKP